MGYGWGKLCPFLFKLKFKSDMALTLQQLKDYRLPIISQPLTRVTTVNELATTNLFEALGSVVGNYEALNPNGSIATTSAISSLWSTGGTTEVDIHTSTFVTGGYYLNNGVLYPQYGNFAITAGNPSTDPQFAQIQFNGIGQYIHIEAYDPSEEGKGLCMTVDNTAITISDSNDGPLGLRYQDDYSANIINQDRSIPDVGTVNQLISNNAYSGKILADSYSGTGTATTAFTVTIGATQANNIYKLSLAPTSLLAMTSYYVSAKTTTTFTITYASALTGAVTFDWVLHP